MFDLLPCLPQQSLLRYWRDWRTHFTRTNIFHGLKYHDDEGVEKDHGLPGMFSVHLVEKIWILVNFIMREDSFDIRPGHFYW